MSDKNKLPVSNAQMLSSSQKSRPYWGGRSPRWICQMMAPRACVPVTGGAYRINSVAEPFIPIQNSTGSAGTADLPSNNLNIMNSHTEGTTLKASFAAYNEAPKDVPLQALQTVVKIHTRIPVLYSTHHNQLEQQLSLAAEYLYETKENLIFNHADYGLLNNVAAPLQLNAGGPPTPELLDEMLGRVWKMPDFFVMHPEALTAFRQQANGQGLTLGNVETLGSSFTAWRDLPILPTNKLHLVSGDRAERAARVAGASTTNVLLMRIGEDKQGVISLYAAGTEGSPRFPFITVDFMGISDESVASYLLTMYAAMAVLTPGALCSAEVTI